MKKPDNMIKVPKAVNNAKGEGVVFKANNPYHPDEGGKFVKFTSDMHMGNLAWDGKKHVVDKVTVAKLLELLNAGKMVTGEANSVSMTLKTTDGKAPVLLIDEQQDFLVKEGEVLTVGGIGKGMAKAMVGTDEVIMTDALYKKLYGKPASAPKAYPMPLLNPKSNWGKRMAEKLAQKS